MLAGKTTSMEVATVSSLYFEQVVHLWVIRNVLNIERQFTGIILGCYGIITINFERLKISFREYNFMINNTTRPLNIC